MQNFAFGNANGKQCGTKWRKQHQKTKHRLCPYPGQGFFFADMRLMSCIASMVSYRYIARSSRKGVPLDIRSMYVPVMPPMEQGIIELITKVDVVQDRQLRHLFRVEERRNNYFMHCLNELFVETGKLVTDEHLVVRADNSHVKTITNIYGEFDSKIEGKVVEPYRKITACLWDVISHIDQVDVKSIDAAESPASIIYTIELFGDPCRLTVVDVYVDESNLHILNTLQERYLNRVLWDDEGKPIKSIILNYVTEDMDLLDTIIERSEPDETGKVLGPIYVPTMLTYVDPNNTDDDGIPKIQHWTSGGESLRLLYATDFEKVRGQEYAVSET